MRRGGLSSAAYVSTTEAATYAAWGHDALEGDVFPLYTKVGRVEPQPQQHEERVASLDRALRLLTEKVREGKVRLRGKRAKNDCFDWEQPFLPIDPAELPAFRCIDWRNRIVWDPKSPMSTWSYLPGLVSWFDLIMSRTDAITFARLFYLPAPVATLPISYRDTVSQDEINTWVARWPSEQPWPPEAKLLTEAQAFFAPRHVSRRSLRYARIFWPPHARGRGRPRKNSNNF